MCLSDEKIDFMSKFYCVVYKPFYYVITPISIVPFIALSTVVDIGLAYLMFILAIITYVVCMVALYKISYRSKVKKDRLRIQKINIGRKTWFVVSTFIIMFIAILLASGISVLLVLNGLK